jgi:hypothetical protein
MADMVPGAHSSSFLPHSNSAFWTHPPPSLPSHPVCRFVVGRPDAAIDYLTILHSYYTMAYSYYYYFYYFYYYSSYVLLVLLLLLLLPVTSQSEC